MSRAERITRRVDRICRRHEKTFDRICWTAPILGLLMLAANVVRFVLTK